MRGTFALIFTLLFAQGALGETHSRDQSRQRPLVQSHKDNSLSLLEITKYLSSDKPFLREYAAIAAGRMEEKASDLLGILKRVQLSDKNPEVQEAAKKAIERIENAQFFTQLATLLKAHPDGLLDFDFRREIELLGTKASPYLFSVLRDSRKSGELGIARSLLAKLGDSTTAEISKVLDDQDPRWALSGQTQLAQTLLQIRSLKSFSSFRDVWLKSASPIRKYAALSALKNTKPKGDEWNFEDGFAKTIVTFLREERSHCRSQAIRASQTYGHLRLCETLSALYDITQEKNPDFYAGYVLRQLEAEQSLQPKTQSPSSGSSYPMIPTRNK